MMKKLLLGIFILVLGCNKEPKMTKVTGDLYFSFFRLGNYYNQPDSLINSFESYFDTVSVDKLNLEEKKIIQHYNILKEKDLLYRPLVYLKTDNDSVISLYLDTSDYDLIKVHKRQKLQDGNKKLRIEAMVKMVDSGIYICKELRSVVMMDGETLQRQHKFKIDDYN